MQRICAEYTITVKVSDIMNTSNENEPDIDSMIKEEGRKLIKKYLNGKPVSKSNFVFVDTKDFHPILAGRLFTKLEIPLFIDAANFLYLDCPDKFFICSFVFPFIFSFLTFSIAFLIS